MLKNNSFSVKAQNIVQVGNFCTSVFPWILSQKTLYVYISPVAICLKWNASPPLKTAKNRTMKRNPNVVITRYSRLCILYIVQVFTLNFTKMLLITFTTTYRLIRKDNRVWSILKTIITGKRCSMDHAVKGRDIKFTFRVDK